MPLRLWRGYLLALAAAFLWATLGLFGKFLYRYPVDPLVVVALRAMIAASTLGLVLAWRNPAWLRIRKQDLPFFFVYGAVGVALNYSCYFLALRWTTVTTAVILLYLYPAFVVLGGALFLGESLTLAKGAALSLAFGGAFLVAQGYDSALLRLNSRGVLFSLGAAISMAVYGLMGKKRAMDYSGWTITLYAIGFGAISLIFWQGAALREAMHYPWQVWLLILGLAWGPTLLAYSFFTLALTYIEAGQASIAAMMEPVLAAVLAYAVLGERLDLPQWLGSLFVLGGVSTLLLKR
ncbi:MAG: EamA family transporter [Anaerolineales bacterium]|jgi:DME family drug/metabolite transporter